MKKLFILVVSLVSLLGVASTIYADSLYDDYTANLYGAPVRRVLVGDIITVVISESTSAVQEATTRTQKGSEFGLDFLSGWDQVANLLGSETIRKTYEAELKGEDNYQGSGQTSRKSRVDALISAVVTEILDNGNVYIVGEHRVKVNNEVETIRVAGIVRPSDIGAGNRVNSFQIAKVELSVNGAGVVGSKQSPGLLTKMFNWLF